ncbi:nudix hydrolase 15, mitochondrial-like isoform X1 [Magnolia sinica]|uniref:nudix hydrolase 15, mitochondrial-like isoform X1 n=1 Tax=Magnolia sinica TaxID=86752 RepID=UPI0026597969|nr:nudix hydrolase 15, mitochondrial-like isoform X1 [Magnolia sinica]
MCMMDSGRGIRRLRNLAQQIRSYRTPPKDADKEERKTASGKVSLAESTAKRAAVLVCIFEGDAGDLRVILTKRASNLSSYSGEVALPGGKAEEGDTDDCETALREAKEEIGLDPSLVTVVTVFNPFSAKKNTRVTPVIGMLYDKQAVKPVANPTEVEVIFDVPLEMFLKDENHWSVEMEWMGIKHHNHHFNFQVGNEKFVIWGLTSAILIHVASVIYQRPPPFNARWPYIKVGTHSGGNVLP